MNSRSKIFGFTIIELLIALIIMGILVAIIVPRYASRTEEAREKAALTDLVLIKDAQQNCEIDTGYLVSLYVLDDVKGDIGDNSIAVEYPFPISSAVQFQIDPEEGDFVDIVGHESDYNNWQGPYITWQKDINGNGIPEDPWGNEYRFFTVLGEVIYKTDVLNTSQENNTSRANFDRFTILSMGKNGLLEIDPNEPTDDLKIQW